MAAVLSRESSIARSSQAGVKWERSQALDRGLTSQDQLRDNLFGSLRMLDQRIHLRWVATALLSLLAPSVVVAQAKAPSPRLWSMSLVLGAAVAHQVTAGVEGAMVAGGYDDTRSCFLFCEGEITYPYTRFDGPSLAVTVRRRLKPILDARAMFGFTPLGETFGYNSAPTSFSSITLRQRVNTYALMLGLRPDSGSGFWIALGPALHGVAMDRTDAVGGPSITSSRLGAVAAIGVEIPTRKGFFVEIQGQYRLVGTVTTPPIDGKWFDGTIEGTLPSTDVNFNHGMLAIGVGARF
jgi:hypothetical protein